MICNVLCTPSSAFPPTVLYSIQQFRPPAPLLPARVTTARMSFLPRLVDSPHIARLSHSCKRYPWQRTSICLSRTQPMSGRWAGVEGRTGRERSSRPVRESVIVLHFPVTFSLLSGSSRAWSDVSSSPVDNGSLWCGRRGAQKTAEDGCVLPADEVWVSRLGED